MEFLSRLSCFFRRRPSDEERQRGEERAALLAALDEAALRKEAAERCFNAVAEDELVISAVYEMEAAAAHYRALLCKARQAGLRREYWEAEKMRRELRTT